MSESTQEWVFFLAQPVEGQCANVYSRIFYKYLTILILKVVSDRQLIFIVEINIVQKWSVVLLLIFLQLHLFIFDATFLTFHFVSVNIKGSENTFVLLVFSASKDLSAVSLPTEDLPVI